MSFSTKVRAGRGVFNLQRVSLIALAAGFAAKPALAEFQITTARTDPIETTNVDGAGLDDDVTVTSAGSITLDGGNDVFITLNSPGADVLNQGSLSSADDSDNVGILIDGSGGYAGSVRNEGAIGLTEAYAPSDTDSNGNLDGPWSNEANNFGIRLSAGSFTGSITQTAAGRITIHGDDSAAVRLDGALTGNLDVAGVVTVRGDNAVGFDLNGPITGNVDIDATTSVSGLNAMGVDIDGTVTGAVRIGGSITATGFFSTTHPTDAQAAELDPGEDDLNGGPAISINASVTGGVEIQGIGVEDDDDDDNDGISDSAETNPDTNDDASAAINVYGSSPAVAIGPGGAGSITLSNSTAWGYGFVNRGGIAANGVQDDFAATGVRIAGAGADTVTVQTGVLNDGRIGATAYDANATGLSLGAGAITPAIVNRNVITADVISGDAGFFAYGVRIEGGASVDAFTNSGAITASVTGDESDAIAFIDEAGTVDSFTNSGSIVARGVVASGVTFTGETIAIDLSANGGGATLTQQAPGAPFTDQDATNDTPDPTVQILGDIRFGAGADVFNVLAGAVSGDIAFGGGADRLFIDNGATVRGLVTDSAGGLELDVQDGVLELLGGGTLDMGAQNGFVGDDGELILHLSTTPAESILLTTTGNFTFGANARITPILPTGLPLDGVIEFLNVEGAGVLDAAGVVGAVEGDSIPWIYNVAIQLDPGDSSILEVAYALKDAVDLGLDRNETAAYDAIVAALRSDPDAAMGFAGIDSQAEFDAGFGDLMPNFSSAATEIAATTIAQGQRASAHRLAAARLSGQRDSTIWLQEVAFGVLRDAEDYGVDFDGTGFGVAAGIDGLMNNGAIFGLSLAFIGAENEATEKTHNIATLQLGQANAYLGFGLGPVDLDAVLGLGVGRVSLSRDVALGAFSASTEADYMTYEGHASLRASAPFSLADWLVIRPYAEALYIGMQEDAYEEAGGGTAVDLVADSVFSQRLWGEAGAEISVPMRLFGADLAPRLTLGYRADLLDEDNERTYRFTHAGAAPFTLTDEPLGDGAPIAGLALQGGDEGTQISVSYEGEFGDTLERHSLLAGVRFRF